MTCIIGTVEEGQVYIGADSAAANSSAITILKNPKVFRKGEMIFGFTTSWRMGQLLQYGLDIPIDNREDPLEYLVIDFVNAVRECYKTGGFSQKWEDGDEKGGTFIIGYKNRLFRIDNNYEVGEHSDNFICLGCGTYYAEGAYYALDKYDIKTEEKILLSLEAAAKFSTGVEGPFKIIKLNK